MTKHTSTPWACKGEALKDFKDPLFWHCDIIKGGIRIARVTGRGKEEAEANAIFILRAVNYHDEAKETLRACLDRLTEMGFSIHEVGLPQTISNLLSKMED